MRLFTGIELPAEVIGRLAALVRQLRPTARINWANPENLHITTKFIGEWPAHRLDELKDALACLPRRPAIPVEIRGLGWFPNPHSPRVFWAAIHAGPGLAELARETDEALALLGVAREEREFRPHLTLARIKAPAGLAELRQAVARLDATDFGAFTASRFFLYLSERGPEGSEYTKLAEFPLERE